MAIQVLHETSFVFGVAAIALGAYIYRSFAFQKQPSQVVIPVKVHD